MFGNRFWRLGVVVGLLWPSLSVATILYVANYLESITSLKLMGSNLKIKAITPGCGQASSWLTLDQATDRLFCLDESSPNGTVSLFETHDDGSLSQLNIVMTLPGTVASSLFGQGNGLAVAYYSGASVATFDVSPKKHDSTERYSHVDLSTLSPVQAETYHLAQPGANALRQDQPHPHHTIIDPSGKYLLVPDLGADLVRIYLLNDDGRLRFTALAPLVMPAGSGPRHGAFLVTPNGDTYLYITSEIANTITGFQVTYTSSSTIECTEIYRSGSHGLGVEFDKGRLAPEEDVFPTLAGEIHVSPDGNFLLVSSRNEGIFTIVNPTDTSAHPQQIPSDPLMTFRIDASNGNLTKLQDFPAGGMVPRQFSISKDGSMVAVGLQQDGRVVVIDRDVQSGLLTGVRAAVDVGYQPTCVIFKEENLLPFAPPTDIREHTPLPVIILLSKVFGGVALMGLAIWGLCICVRRRRHRRSRHNPAAKSTTRWVPSWWPRGETNRGSRRYEPVTRSKEEEDDDFKDGDGIEERMLEEGGSGSGEGRESKNDNNAGCHDLGSVEKDIGDARAGEGQA